LTDAVAERAADKLWLSDMTWEEAKERIAEAKGVAIVPVGAIEQHGRHLPLGTDSYVAIDLTREAAERTEVVAVPPIYYGMSRHHMVLPGTITVRPEILIELVYDVITSLAEHGCRAFVLLNGHRVSNLPWLSLVAERVHREFEELKVVIFDPAYMAKEIGPKIGFEEIGHADEVETSHMLHLRPELCKMAKAKDSEPEEAELSHVDPRSPRDTLCYAPSRTPDALRRAQESGGVSGTPTRATAERGRQYHEHVLGRLIRVVEMLRGSSS